MSQAERVETQQVGVQFLLHPLRQERLRPAIEAAVQAAAKEGIAVTVGRLGTFASGSEEAVFAAVKAAFVAARSYGPTVMVITLSSGLLSEDTVASIQTAARTDPTRLRRV
jgi:uncharacterized protein YqgV (UPF0045/DUF77 family)